MGIGVATPRQDLRALRPPRGRDTFQNRLYLLALLILCMTGPVMTAATAQELPSAKVAGEPSATKNPPHAADSPAGKANDYRGIRFQGLVYRVPPKARPVTHAGTVIGLLGLMAVVTRTAVRKMRPPLDASDLRKLWYLCFFVLVLPAGALWGIRPHWQGRLMVIGGCVALATICRAAADLHSKLLAKKMVQGLEQLLSQAADDASSTESHN